MIRSASPAFNTPTIVRLALSRQASPNSRIDVTEPSRERGADARFDVLHYDLTSTCFESDPPFEDKRQFGYSRDERSDCVQMVIALIVTPDGIPLAYEVMPGNTSDNTTLAGFLEKIENQYGRSDRV